MRTNETLQEFAKIAAKKGLIKEAAGPRDMPPAAPAQPISVSPPTFQTGYGQKVPDAPMASTVKVPISDPLEELVAFYAVQGKGKNLESLRTQIVASMTDKLGRNPTKQEVDAFIARVQKLLTTKASVEINLTKEGAGEKLYDVSGETGEKLIETAHSETAKVNDQVVENQVEQQKADIAIINKKPTGKYAALITLADELDALGLHKYADRIDTLIKSALEMKELPKIDPAATWGKIVPSDPTEPAIVSYPVLTPEQLKVRKWQERFNKQHPKQPIKSDGIWGPESQKAYENERKGIPTLPPIPGPQQQQQSGVKVDIAKQDASKIADQMFPEVVRMMGLTTHKQLSTNAIGDIKRGLFNTALDSQKYVASGGTEFKTQESFEASIKNRIRSQLTPAVLNAWKTMK